MKQNFSSYPKPTKRAWLGRAFAISLILLSLSSCSTNQVRYFFESEAWDRFCGCAPKEKDASTFASIWEAMGELELGALWRVGKDNYLVRLYKGIKKAYEFQGAKFEKLDKEYYERLEVADAKDVIREKDLDFIFMKIIEIGVDHKSDLLVFNANQFFQRGSANLSPYAKAHIEIITAGLVNYPDSILRIKVHTSNAGSERGNQSLSESRAKNLQKTLEQAGNIEPKRFKQVAGLGSAESRIKENEINYGNNRVEIFFETPLENEIDTYQFDKKLEYGTN